MSPAAVILAASADGRIGLGGGDGTMGPWPLTLLVLLATGFMLWSVGSALCFLVLTAESRRLWVGVVTCLYAPMVYALVHLLPGFVSWLSGNLSAGLVFCGLMVYGGFVIRGELKTRWEWVRKEESAERLDRYRTGAHLEYEDE